MIRTNLDLPISTIIPDAFIHLPEQLGGLGLRNPFVPLLLVRDALLDKSPGDLLETFLREEHDEYLEYKKTFDETAGWRLRSRLAEICPDNSDSGSDSGSDTELDDDDDDNNPSGSESDSDDDSDSNKDTPTATATTTTSKLPRQKTINPREVTKFMSLDEFAFFREHTSRPLHDLYTHTLLAVPRAKGISLDKKTLDALDEVSRSAPTTGETPRVPNPNQNYHGRRGGSYGRGGRGRGGNYYAAGGRRISESDVDDDKKKTKNMSLPLLTLTPENKWFVALYAEELLATYGALSLVDKQFLPGGVLSMMREKKVTWQMVL